MTLTASPLFTAAVATLVFLAQTARAAAPPAKGFAGKTIRFTASEATPSVAAAVEFLPAEGPRALSEQGRTNLIAFARLFGYVRHFHPSDEAAATRWDHVAIRGVRDVERADDAHSLADALRGLFSEIAPTVQVFPTIEPSDELPASLELPDTDGKRYVTFFDHLGVGLNNKSSAYRSVRVRKWIREGVLPERAPAPNEPLELALGGGVACRLPLALFMDATKRTLPIRSTGNGDTHALPAGYRVTGDDRATRLGGIVIAWNVFQHFYPYFDIARADWGDVLVASLDAAATDANERSYLDTLRILVAALEDGHGHVSHLSDRAYGALPFAASWIEDALVVTGVAASSSGELAAGDVIASIDGTPTDEAASRAAARISSATPQYMRHRLVRELLRGPPGETVELRVETPDGESRTIELRFRRTRFEPAELDVITEIVDGVWYVDLDRVTTEEFQAALSELADARGIVFDMRGYPRQLDAFRFFPHLSRETLHSPEWRTPIVTRPDREGFKFADNRWTIRPKAPYLAAPKAFLTDGSAISYAESCMGIVEHYKLGEIVGGPTAGTNGNINPFELPGGYRISWTGMRVMKHDGTNHHGVGILPTKPVDWTRDDVIEGRDPVLERALDVISR